MLASLRLLVSSPAASPRHRAGALRLVQSQATTDAESAITNKLIQGIDGVKSVKVQDTSGGCGAMYSIEITADAFKGKSILASQKLVYKALAEDIGKWHGLTLVTKPA